MGKGKSAKNNPAAKEPDLEATWGAKTDSEEIFESLVRNAFDFLRRGVEEFESAPKYSVIHFCAAVEMLLKARLMREHWSLIVSKIEHATLAKFMSGDFVSVTMDEARERLRNIAEEDIPADAFESFRRLAKHRNKMIHFFHAGIEQDESSRAKIVAEYCQSWRHIHNLLNRWGNYFDDFSSDIAKADRSMRRNRKYLSTVFDMLKEKIGELKKEGKKFKKCHSCKFVSAAIDYPSPKLSVSHCLVCGYSETSVEMNCPHCSNGVVLTGEGEGICAHCEEFIEPKHVAANLVDPNLASAAAMSGDNSYDEASCCNCDGVDTVVRLGDRHFCTACFTLYEPHELNHCDWCGALNAGDMGESQWLGCVACDGAAGKIADD